MKKIVLKLLLILVLAVPLQTQAGFFDELINGNEPRLNICDSEECNLRTWVELVEGTIDYVETGRTFSAYVQDLILYILSFVSLIAFIYILYAWFQVLTAAGEEDKVKKAKQTIMYVFVWILLIWLAYPITLWIISFVNT